MHVNRLILQKDREDRHSIVKQLFSYPSSLRGQEVEDYKYNLWKADIKGTVMDFPKNILSGLKIW